MIVNIFPSALAEEPCEVVEVSQEEFPAWLEARLADGGTIAFEVEES